MLAMTNNNNNNGGNNNNNNNNNDSSRGERSVELYDGVRPLHTSATVLQRAWRRVRPSKLVFLYDVL
jgi:hypothetical protein